MLAHCCFVDEKLLDIISLLKTITQAPLIQIPVPKNFQQLIKNMASPDSVGNSLQLHVCVSLIDLM